MRARQVHGRGGRLPGHLRTGRDPSAQRSVRRGARPPARGGHRGAGRHDRHRRRLPAGSRPAEPLQGRRAQLRHHRDERRLRPARDRSRIPHRALGSVRDLRDRPQGPAGRAGQGAGAARAQHDPFQCGMVQSAHRAARRGSQARRRSSQRGRQSRHVDRGGRDAGCRRSASGRRRARRRSRQGPSRKGRASRRPARRHRIDRPF